MTRMHYEAGRTRFGGEVIAGGAEVTVGSDVTGWAAASVGTPDGRSPV